MMTTILLLHPSNLDDFYFFFVILRKSLNLVKSIDKVNYFSDLVKMLTRFLDFTYVHAFVLCVFICIDLQYQQSDNYTCQILETPY